jgi:hypothetical protein
MKILIPVLFIISVLISLLTSGCNPSSSETGLLTLRGTVSDTNIPGSKISGATALLEQTGQSAISDSSGVFTFTNLSVTTYTIVVTKPGYYRYSTNIEITSDDTLKLIKVPLIFRNIFVFNNIVMDEYFSDASYSSANFLTGQAVQDNSTDKDVLFRDTLIGTDTRLYLRSASMDVINTGRATWFTNMLGQPGLPQPFTKEQFDTLTKYPSADGKLYESDFPYHEGIDNFLNLGGQHYICAFYLKGRYSGSGYPTYGLLYIDSVWFDAGQNMRRILVDIKINKNGDNIFNPNYTKK